MVASPFILIGTPCYGGLVAQGYMQSIMKLAVLASSSNFEICLALNGHDSLITRSRNTIVASFLDMPQATHLMFIDADIAFEPEYVKRMLDFNGDVVAGMYPIKNIDWPRLRQGLTPDIPDDRVAEIGLNFVGSPCPEGEREEIDGFVTGVYAGTGFKLIKRSVIERMVLAYPELKYNKAQTWPRPKHESDNQYALFECMIEPGTRSYLSEDFAFCRRWRELGGKIWLDTRSRLTHIGTYKFEGSPEMSIIPMKV